MLQTATAPMNVQSLSSEELSTLLLKCESAIADGSAGIDDYEAFVLCQQELARRLWN